MKRITLNLFILFGSVFGLALVHIPIHEIAHQLGGIIAGGGWVSIGIQFGNGLFDAKVVAYPDPSLEGWRYTVFVGGPSIFLYIPGSIAIWVLKGRGIRSFILSINVMWGGAYAAYSLIMRKDDFWIMAQQGIPIELIVFFAVFWIIAGVYGLWLPMLDILTRIFGGANPNSKARPIH